MKEELIECYKTHTGEIYVDRQRCLEFLSVGDYGADKNIKANFLGHYKEIHGVRNTEVDLSKKWVATISTQHGCPMKCRFCDCPKVGYRGNVSMDDLGYQIRTIIKTNKDVTHNFPYHTERFNVHYARMGEPTWNRDVLGFTWLKLREIVYDTGLMADTVHPVLSTMLPVSNNDLESYVKEWCCIKNESYKGEAGLQFSINSTDDRQRDYQFRGQSCHLNAISKLAELLPCHKGRKYTLNFPVTKDTILDAKKLSSMFDRQNWIVKITPIHQTKAAVDNGFDVGTEYEDYDVYRRFEDPLLEEGWDVIVFVPSIEEDSDRITCGNALISKGGAE